MIDRITLKNYQVHRRLDIQLDRITTFIGESDQGKSSILRAIRWACINRPNGDDFIRHGSKSTSVVIYLEGNRIIRRKGEKENTYHLNTQEYRSFGAAVPEDISSLLNVGHVNFQIQLDLGEPESRPAFWFSLTPGQAAKELNDLAGLGNVDTALSYAHKTLKRAEAQAELCAARKRTLGAEIKALAWTANADQELQHIEMIDRKLRSLQEDADCLSELLDEIDELSKSRSVEIPPTDEIDAIVSELEMARERRKALDNLTIKISQERKARCQAQKRLRQMQKKFKKMQEGRCPLCGREEKS